MKLPAERPIRVCLLLEGSYPFITGGVSAWVQDLIQGLPHIEFSLFTISPEADMELRYELPQNVSEHQDVVLREVEKNKAKIPESKYNKNDFVNALVGFHKDLAESKFANPSVFYGFEDNDAQFFDAVDSRQGWDLLRKTNAEKNPIYPFADYFWAWSSAHYMMFKVLATSPPAADIYHAISTGYAGLAGLKARYKKGVPLLLTEHGLYHKEREMEIRKSKYVRGYQRDMWINLYNSISRLTYSNADTITALFEENRQKQIELGAAPEKCVVIPNGIDIERFSVVRQKRPGYHIGLVGRVVPIKDIKTFILAAKIVHDALPDVIFYCIGPTDEDPGYYNDCRMLTESLKITRRFKFTGRQNVTEYYAFLDILLLTSIREAQPLVILEAYCAGIPVASTNVGNVAELLDYDDRFLAAPKDAGKLAQSVIFSHNNPKVIEDLSVKNRERVKMFYDKKDLHQKYEELYETLAAKGRAGENAWQA